MEETFGEYIHLLRIKNKMTLGKLATALDLDQSTISKIENNKRNVTEEILPKLSGVFNLDLKILQKEFYSDKIASIIFEQEDCHEVLKLAKLKIRRRSMKQK